ncbi:MAG: hypothetical protein KAS12_07440, partial [Candidatus Aenigmarchaeota archaeon]|nr:hypothetical protein [Candidatus Aenigmarchaeota archaeon]
KKEKKEQKPIPGPKSKFDSLFEYGRRDNPDIDPEKQQKLMDEIDKIKEEERENMQNRQNNRIGEVETDYMQRPTTTATNIQRQPSYFSSNNNPSNSYARPDRQNAFTNNQASTFAPPQTTTQPLNVFNSPKPSTGSSFLGSIMDSAMQSTNRQQQTENLATPQPTAQPVWQPTQSAKEPIKKPQEDKKDDGDKDWVPMGLFGN